MTCATCIRWQRRDKPGSRFGFCKWPGSGPRPYWHLERPEAVLMVHETHGAGCLAYLPKK